MAKKNCKFSIVYNNRKIEFNSDKELDLFLREHEEELIALAKVNMESLDKIFQADPREVTKAILEDIRIDVQNAQVEIVRDATDPSEFEKIYKIPDSKGVSKLIGELQWVTPFNVEGLKRKRLIDYSNDGLNVTEAEQKVQDEVSSWQFMTDIGTEIHDFIDSVIQNKSFTSTLLTEAHKSNLRHQVENFIESVKRDLQDDDLTIYSEFAIKSKFLNMDKETILEQQGITSLNGRLDFLIVDKFGDIYLYDWKVSPKKTGSWGETSNTAIALQEKRLGYKLYPSSKKETINYQLSAYAAMLKQYGLNVKGINVVPVTTQLEREADGFTVKELHNITIETPVRINDFALRGRVANRVAEYLTSEESAKEISISLTSTAETLSELFPEHTFNFHIQQFDANIEYYKNKPRFVQVIQPGDVHYGKYKYKFYTDGLTDARMVYCFDEIDRDLELAKYVGLLKQAKSSELINLGRTIALIIKGQLQLSEIGRSMNPSQSARLESTFKKYILGGWAFTDNEDLNNAGFFIFKKDGKIEIVMMTNDPLMTERSLGKSRSMLGQFMKTRDRDSRRVLSSSNAHMEAFKALAYIAHNSENFKDHKIANIKVVNPWHGNSVATVNSDLLNTWGQLMHYHKRTNILSEALFVSDAVQAMALAEDVIESMNIDVSELTSLSDIMNLENQTEALEQYIFEFVRKHNKLTDWDARTSQDPIWEAYSYLLNAQGALKGYRTHVEQDIGDWTNGSLWNLTGLRMSSIQTSPSANMRALGEIMNDYSAAVAADFNDTAFPIRMALSDFYKVSGGLKALGGEAGYFLSWFEDLDNLILKRPEHPDFDGQPEARVALTLILEAMGKLRWKTEADIELAKETGRYYELPLMEAKFNRLVKRLGIKQAAKHVWTKHTNLFEGVFGTKEEKEAKQLWEKTERSTYNRFRNQLNPAERAQYIEKMTSGFFETDVERVFGETLLAYSKEARSREYVPFIMGMKLALANQEEKDHIKIAKIRKAFDDYVQKKFYGNPIVDEYLQPLHAYLSFLKAGFSKMVLGMNSRSFAREILQGTWTGLSRAAVERIPGLDFEHYTDAYNWVVQRAATNIKVASLSRQLGATYRMANMSLNEMVSQSRVNWMGIKNWNSDTLFLTATSPDFLHRTIILVAKMMVDGSLDAHTLNEETSKLEYDWTLDKRFDVYAKGDTSDPKYIYQKTLYLKLLEEWNTKGSMLKEGDPLPMAYTTREARTMRNWGNFLFGHYDTEVRALINDSFLGSLFMQYRTFVTAKLEQWLIAPGSYNMDRLELQYDEDSGEELWEVAVYPNKDLTGMPTRKIIKLSEVTQEERDGSFARPYLAWQGDPLEGMAHGMARFVKAFGKIGQGELNKLWQDPFERKQLLTGLHDLLGMMLLAMVIKAIFSEDIVGDMKNQAWLTQWTYAVTMGSTQDGPIHQVLAGILGDLDPPLAGSIKKIVNSSWSIINGDDTIGYAMTQNIGAIREFQGVVRALND